MWPHTACGIETCFISYHNDNSCHVTCDLIPLAVLKRAGMTRLCALRMKSHVTSYRLRYWNKGLKNFGTIGSVVTCDLIPLAVLKRREIFPWHAKLTLSHVTSYRLRYWNVYISNSYIFPCSGHMWPHTACGIETTMMQLTITSKCLVTCDLIPLAVLKL